MTQNTHVRARTRAHSSSLFSEALRNTLVHIFKKKHPPSFSPSCCAYNARWLQIKRGLILRRAILLDLRWAFSLFHSLQTVFGALSAQYGESITGESRGAAAGLQRGNTPNTPCPLQACTVMCTETTPPPLLNYPDFKAGEHSLIAL